MSAPSKAWENIATNMRMNPESFSSLGRQALNSNAPRMANQPSGNVRNTSLPPLPSRPPQLNLHQMNRPNYNMGINNMFGGYSGFGGYGGYSSYGSYPGSLYPGGYGYGNYGMPGGPLENRFLIAAEESSRNAFQSIESLVRAFTSVSMMLESTYAAMYSSFRAVLGVVDNFSRLRQMFSQFISAITILSVIKNFYKQLLYWLGVIDQNPQSEQVWNSVTDDAVTSVAGTANYSKWPIITFVGLLFGGPYLISKLFTNNSDDKKTWERTEGVDCKAAYPHTAGSNAELSFAKNETLNLAPKKMQTLGKSGWLLACNAQGDVGYVPITRISCSEAVHRPVPPTIPEPQ